MKTNELVRNRDERTDTLANRRFLTPSTDIVETGEEIVVHLDLPGVPRDSIEVEFERGLLRVTAERRSQDASVEGRRLLVEEFTSGPYVRKFRVGNTVDASRIVADYEGGVLTLRLPKVEASRKRRIQVQGE